MYDNNCLIPLWLCDKLVWVGLKSDEGTLSFTFGVEPTILNKYLYKDYAPTTGLLLIQRPKWPPALLERWSTVLNQVAHINPEWFSLPGSHKLNEPPSRLKYIEVSLWRRRSTAVGTGERCVNRDLSKPDKAHIKLKLILIPDPPLASTRPPALPRRSTLSKLIYPPPLSLLASSSRFIVACLIDCWIAEVWFLRVPIFWLHSFIETSDHELNRINNHRSLNYK